MGGKRFKSSKIHMDKISELPDEILFVILCMLTMKEAGRTSILSHRWRYLWEISLASSSNLILDVIAMRGIEYPEDVAKLMTVECPDNLLRSERCKFARFIQPILHLDHCSPKELCSFRFYLDGGYAHLIDKFIKLALAKRCRNLEIDLCPFGGACDACYFEEKYYKFPSHFPTQEIGSSVKRLCLKACNLMFFRSKIFNSLVDLHLEFALIDDVRISRVLSNCPDLKKLCLVKCDHLRRLKITGPSLKLKCLTVVFCEELRKIKIDSKTLTNFNYCGDRIKITFLKVPQLANVIMRTRSAKGALSYALRNLSSDLPHLEYLFLAVQSIEKRKIPRQLPIFANLKKLVLRGLFCNTNLWGIILLLQASPNITRLELNVLTSNIKDGDRPSNFHHHHLEEIVLSGFSGCKGDIEFAKYLLNSAITLKKFIIFRKFIVYEHVTGDLPKIVKENIERLEKQKADGCGKEEPIGSVWDSLVEVARPGVELVIDRVNYASGARVNYVSGAE